MNINRYNYEEFFLLYVDGELSGSARKAVELFIEENPDLEEEMVMLKQSVLKPEPVVFEKDSLFRKNEELKLNIENYESFFLLYVDDELRANERREVEAFASSQPSLQQELELLLQTRIDPNDKIVFENKEKLFRKESDKKPVLIVLWRAVAVAAVLILTLGIFWLNRQEVGSNDPVLTDNNKKIIQPAVIDQDVNKRTSEKARTDKEETQSIAKVEQAVNGNENQTAKKINRKSEMRKVEEDKKTNFLAMNTYEPKEEIIDEPMVASTLVNKANNTTAVESTTAFADKYLLVDRPATTTEASEDIQLASADENIAVGPIQTKNRLRGIFRKVSRVVGKTTNLSSGEGRSLLIGNLEIALK